MPGRSSSSPKQPTRPIRNDSTSFRQSTATSRAPIGAPTKSRPSQSPSSRFAFPGGSSADAKRDADCTPKPTGQHETRPSWPTNSTKSTTSRYAPTRSFAALPRTSPCNSCSLRQATFSATSTDTTAHPGTPRRSRNWSTAARQNLPKSATTTAKPAKTPAASSTPAECSGAAAYSP